MSVAQRRLAFLNKDGYDRFGKNKLFAPLMKWEALKEQVEGMREHAKSFENAYNVIMESIKRQDGIREVLQAFPQAARIQVSKGKDRLEEARRVAVSEKGAYVLVSLFLQNI